MKNEKNIWKFFFRIISVHILSWLCQQELSCCMSVPYIFMFYVLFLSAFEDKEKIAGIEFITAEKQEG